MSVSIKIRKLIFPMKKPDLSVLTLTIAVLVVVLVTLLLLNWLGNFVQSPESVSYRVVNVYPHDSNAFTQGLVFDNGFLYEGTGLYGQSSVRQVELGTGKILQFYALPRQFFGEGITIYEDKIIQLTWRSNRGFVYDKHNFELLMEFSYPTEGWGITHNGSHLIMSDGTASLYFLNPETFAVEGHVEVHDEEPVEYLNELEYINGEVFANIWFSPKIARIDPSTGKVSEFLDLTTIHGFKSLDPDNVLNGIAYDAVNDRIFVTGKRWSQIFEISLIDSDES